MVFKFSLNVKTPPSFQSHLPELLSHSTLTNTTSKLNIPSPPLCLSHDQSPLLHISNKRRTTPSLHPQNQNTLHATMCSSLTTLLLLTLLSSALPFSHQKKQHPPNNNTSQNFNNNNMDSFELETLFKVMDTISSDKNWRVVYPNPCKSPWIGIECKQGKDNHQHVSRLDFGSPPNPTCKRTATFPPQIFDLPYLQSLFFLHCFTVTKTSMSIPFTVSSAASLQQLSLRSNPALGGPFPPQISSLKSLQILTLSQNKLNGRIPVQIFSLSSLIHLDLSYNSLSGSVPNQVGMLRNLVGLDLSYNSLTGMIPPTIGQLGLLQKLDLSSNLLSGPVPDSIEALNSLVFVALSNNRLQGQFPKGLSKLHNLQYFLMDDNPMFIPLPYEFGRLLRLQELRLANSGYSGTIPQSLTQLQNLSTLSLQNNRLTGEIPAGLSTLSHMYHLNLSKNMLSGVVPFNAEFCRRLGRNLDLNGNLGLCLDGSEALEGVKIGVDVCGSNNRSSSTTASVIKPLRKSEAHHQFGLSRLLLSFIVLINIFNTWAVLYQPLF